MSINFTSVTVTNGSDQVAINTSIDLTAIQYGWELQVVGAPLMLSIASGGQNVITLQEPYTATGTLTNVAAKIIETKAALSAALDNVTLFGNEMINTKNTNQAIIDALGTAANADVTSSITGGVAGQVTTVGYGGLGSVSFMDLRLTNIDNIHKTGFYGGYGGNNGQASTGDNPFPDSGGGFALAVHKGINNVGNQYVVQEAADFSGSLVTKKIRSRNTGVWSAWVTLFHTGNLVNPLDFGIGVSATVPAIGNFNIADFGGLFRTVGAEVGSPQLSSIATVLNMKNSATQVSQLYLRGDSISGDVHMHARGGNVDTETFTPWATFFHTLNTNFEVFGGEGGGTRPIAQAVALSPTTAVAYLHTVSFALPTGITLSAGSTFSLRRPDNTLLRTGLTNLTIDSFSGGRIVKVFIGGASGLTKDEPLDLLKGASNDQIKVNF
jgi:hypothetical protein